MAISRRDPQKTLVYRWEDKFVLPRCPRIVSRENAQTFVNGVFLANGWGHPPLIEAISKRASKTWATGCRGAIRMPDELPAWVLCHEISHSLTSTVDGKSDGHGKDFVGVYLGLLQRVCGMSIFELLYTLKDSKVEFNLAAKPWF